MNRQNYDPRKNYLRIVERGVAHKGSSLPDSLRNENGIVVHEGVYTIGGVTTGCPSHPYCQPRKGKILLGQTPETEQLQFGWAVVKVYEQTISNVWNANVNSISESAWEYFQIPIVLSPAITEDFTATYSATDIDMSNGIGDFINPFDILGYGLYDNDDVDGLVLDKSEVAEKEIVALHEVGHSLGIAVPITCPDVHGCHPKTGSSVMREGWGPGVSLSFTEDDISQMKLKQ